MSHAREPAKRGFWNSWSGICTILLLAALLFFLITEHTAHFFGVLPWAILLLCPILHLFMHRGHGGHGGHVGHDPSAEGEHAQRRTPNEGHQHGGHH